MDIEYTIKCSAKRKMLTITVERDRRIVVQALEDVSDERIAEIVTLKNQWIYEKIGHPQKYQDTPHSPGKELVSGESLLYLGRQYRVELVSDDSCDIRFDQKFYIPEVNNAAASRAELLKEWYVKKAEEK